MKFTRNMIALGIVGVLLSGQNALAGSSEKKQEEQATSASKSQKQNSQKTRKVTGVILKHKVVNIFPTQQAEKEAQSGKKDQEGSKALVTMIKTDKGNERLMVDLGPVDQVPAIKDGETKIQAEGRLVQIGERQLFVASKAKLDEKMLSISRQKF